VSADIVRPNELRQRLDLSWSRFCELQRLGRYRHLEHRNASQTLGTRVYHRRKVEAWFEDRLLVVTRQKAG
jgi:hypothetical protein